MVSIYRRERACVVGDPLAIAAFSHSQLLTRCAGQTIYLLSNGYITSYNVNISRLVAEVLF